MGCLWQVSPDAISAADHCCLASGLRLVAWTAEPGRVHVTECNLHAEATHNVNQALTQKRHGV